MGNDARVKDLFRTIGKDTARPDAVDKVKGKAKFGADVYQSGMLHARLLGSEYAHAKIISIDTSEAAQLEGVKAIVTGEDFPKADMSGIGPWINDNMARGKALYHGQSVAAVAATSVKVAEAAIELIKVEYEPLPVLTDAAAAMADDAPILHDFLDEPPSTNVYASETISEGDIEAGFAEADIILEDDFSVPTAHQGYIEPPACLADCQDANVSTIWTTTQGHFIVQANVARTLGLEFSRINVVPTEIGGGFGGKGSPYLESIALLLSKKAGKPVKCVMRRDEVFRRTGPGAAFQGHYKIGAKNDGTLTAFQADFNFESGAFPGAPLHGGMDTIFRCYRIPNIEVNGCAVLTNKPMVRAYRGPGGPQVTLGTEVLMNELAKKLDLDPIELRKKNAVVEGDPGSVGLFRKIGFEECLDAAAGSDHYRSEAKPGESRALAAAYWHNGGGPSSVVLKMNTDGTANLMTGAVDLSGTRTTLAMIAAERLGLDVEHVHASVGDTESTGYNFVTGGSRTVNVGGQAVLMAADEVLRQLAERAASGWNITPDRIEWDQGEAVNPDNGERLSIAAICRKAPYTGGTITGTGSLSVQPDISPSFAVHICDLKVDEDTGQSKITRYTVVQDAGCAVHPKFVEGQFQGGAVQGIGWALNEEYVYNDDGVLENPAFLDYRIPLASDLPMIETIIVEVPNPLHPYGVRGVGEAGVVPPLAAVASAITNATGVLMKDLPCSPTNVWQAIHDTNNS